MNMNMPHLWNSCLTLTECRVDGSALFDGLALWHRAQARTKSRTSLVTLRHQNLSVIFFIVAVWLKCAPPTGSACNDDNMRTSSLGSTITLHSLSPVDRFIRTPSQTAKDSAFSRILRFPFFEQPSGYCFICMYVKID